MCKADRVKLPTRFLRPAIRSSRPRRRDRKSTDRSVPLKPTIHHILCRNERYRSALSALVGENRASLWASKCSSKERVMSTREHFFAMSVRAAHAGLSSVTRTKAVALQAIQTLTGTARDALFAYAMTGSAVASLAIIAAPHLEMLLRCAFHGRG
jgi:hypothetical protein